MKPWTRQLGKEPGVQLNPLRDESELPATNGVEDQSFAIAGRFTRGRIDKAFIVNRGNLRQRLGKGESIRTLALNEAYVHVVEALNNGGYQAVVSRLITSAAVVKWVVASLVPIGSGASLTAVLTDGVITDVTVVGGGTGYTGGATINITGPGTGAELTPVISVEGVITDVTVTHGGTGYTTATLAVESSENTIGWTLATSDPIDHLLAVKHLECFNDGIQVEIHSDEKRSGGALVDNDMVMLVIKDIDGNPLYEFSGSLDPTKVDDYGNTLHLPDVVTNQTDAVIVDTGAILAIDKDSLAYGYDADGEPQWSKSGLKVAFTEGGTGYTTPDYQSARERLQYTPFNFSYLIGGGTEAAGLIAQLLILSHDTNSQLRLDVPGDLDVEAAINWVEQLNLDGATSSHLVHVFWTPLLSNDPTGVNPKSYFGVSGLNVAFGCGRNAQTNAYDLAPKQYPIAGKAWPINRNGIVQVITPTQQELNQLAAAKINPVIFKTFSGGGLYVFSDQLTSAPVDVSQKALISVIDMACDIDTRITRYGNDIIHLPMDIAIKRLYQYLDSLFTAAYSSGWLHDAPVKGTDYTVLPNAARPYDRIDAAYGLAYTGAVRQIFVTQTLSMYKK